MELWGGIECTLNRVGGRRFDQLARCGHYDRADDLDRIATLGIEKLRYPVLWERTARSSHEYDWSFADERLARLDALGITPIAGLVHHGSGPEWASIETDSFAPRLAEYAAAVARRYPWLEWYTPVNEPLTTARFCGLYGHWFPHARDERVFARMLVNQCRATVLAMSAIRAVNSHARLVQTDDLGTIYSTPRLAYQAEFENHRRWLGWDLLCGRVDASHPMHRHLLAWGVLRHELMWFEEHACPPDVIGIDHYVTSDRYLDEDLERYPPRCRGGNSRTRYADVEAVRVLPRHGTSLAGIVAEAAKRYSSPVALTEIHIGSAPVEQMHWLHDAWVACEQLGAAGVAVHAVTPWALLGSYDWDSLVTEDFGNYEPGAFELRDAALDRTALAAFISAIAASRRERSAIPVPSGRGWWRRSERLTYPIGVERESLAPRRAS